MEEDLNILENGRQPQYFWEDDLKLFPMQDNLNFVQMDDNLNLIQMEYNLNILANGRQPKTIKIKTMVVTPLRVT